MQNILDLWLDTMPEKRKIAMITTSHADYSHLYWPLCDRAVHSEVDLRLIVLGPHLSPEFGSAVREIERDGFKIDARIECLLSSDTDVGMAKTIGLATLSLADQLGVMRPDLLLLIADRYEMLGPAAVALALRIPVAHIEGGEISQDAIDDAIRNALTKMAHVHFTSTETARQRVIAMGEEPGRVHRAGTPSLTICGEQRCCVKQLALPLRDLVGMDVELLGQLGQSLLTLYCGQGNLRLERRRVIPARTHTHRFSSSQPS